MDTSLTDMVPHRAMDISQRDMNTTHVEKVPLRKTETNPQEMTLHKRNETRQNNKLKYTQIIQIRL
jgi:hypothetical protein